MFGPAKRPILLAVLDNALGKGLADARKFFKSFACGGINIDWLQVDLRVTGPSTGKVGEKLTRSCLIRLRPGSALLLGLSS